VLPAPRLRCHQSLESGRVGDRRGGVQEEPICFRPFWWRCLTRFSITPSPAPGRGDGSRGFLLAAGVEPETYSDSAPPGLTSTVRRCRPGSGVEQDTGHVSACATQRTVWCPSAGPPNQMSPNTGSRVTNGRFSACDCAISTRSKGSWCGPGRPPARWAWSTVMGRGRKP